MSGKSSSKGGSKSGRSGDKSIGQCGIYDKIASLDDCLTLPESKKFPALVHGIQQILNQLAYYMVNSDGAVLEYTEQWHTQFTDRLYAAAGQPRVDAISKRTNTTGAAPGGPSPGASVHDTSERVLPPAIPKRAPVDDIPASLRKIMNGSHESLNESDDEAL